MRHMITAALALSLMGGAALAQDRHDDRRDDRGGHEDHRGGEEHRGPENRGGPYVPNGPGRAPGPAVQAGPRPGFEAGRPGGDRGRPDFRRGPEPGFRPGFYLRDRGWHDGGVRFRAPFYRYPSGWGYRRWAFGAFLPGVFLAPDYFLGSYWIYGLPAPPPGYHWIRVGPDALLVRYGDGYVLDVAYGIFY